MSNNFFKSCSCCGLAAHGVYDQVRIDCAPRSRLWLEEGSLPMTPAQVFAQHGYCPDCYYLFDHQVLPGKHWLKPCAALLAALDAARPHPSREALDAIFREEGWCDCHLTKQECANGKVKDRLIAWATTGENKTWCEHIEWLIYPADDSRSHWNYLKASQGESMWVPEQWQFCPLCATPRPRP